MSEIAEFPLPADVTDEERATAKREISKYTKIVSETPRIISFEGELIGRRAVHVASGDVHMAARRTKLAAGNFERCRLPRAVRAQERHHALLRHDKVDAVQRLDASVRSAHVAKLEDRRAHAASPSDPR